MDSKDEEWSFLLPNSREPQRQCPGHCLLNLTSGLAHSRVPVCLFGSLHHTVSAESPDLTLSLNRPKTGTHGLTFISHTAQS